MKKTLDQFLQQRIDSVFSKKYGGTRKIKSFNKPCMHPEHLPAKHRVFDPGEYEHTCPSCGHITRFTVPLIFC